MVFMPGVPWFPPGASWATRPTKSPRRKPGDSGSPASPLSMRRRFAPGNHVPSCGMKNRMVFMPGVPGFPPGASWATRPTKSPRRKPGDSGSPASPVTMRRGFAPGTHVPSCGMEDRVVFMPGVPGLPPGASWATRPTKSPRRKPGDSGSPASPVTMRRGFAPGTHVPSCGMEDRMVFMPGVPGFPPGASWATRGGGHSPLARMPARS